MAVFVAVAATYLIAGVLLMERRGGNVLGPILVGLGAFIAAYVTFDTIVRLPDAPTAAPYLALTVTLMDGPVFAMVAFLFLLFPTGRLPARRWRWLALATIAFGGISMIGTALTPGPMAFYPEIDNPLQVSSDVAAEIVPTFYLLTIVCVGLAALSLLGRWRGGGAVERAQLKWVSVAAGLVTAVMVSYGLIFGPGNFNDIADIAVGVSLAFFPIAIGIAVLRYRLYEIDRIISRTLGWAIVTGLLVAVFALLVVGLQAVLSGFTQGQTLAVAASTLVAATLFQPVRRRVQHAVDRRFDRARYDAERTATAFAERLRDETDIATVTEDLAATAGATLAPASLWIWLRRP
jgi:hypothetical protein